MMSERPTMGVFKRTEEDGGGAERNASLLWRLVMEFLPRVGQEWRRT